MEVREMRGLVICCPELRKAIMRHGVQVDYVSGRVIDLHGVEHEVCPICKKPFEWKEVGL